MPVAAENVLATMVFILVLCVYVPTVYPTVPGGDSGELLAAVCTMGVAHPPGYPLWTMLSIAFSRLVPEGLDPICENCAHSSVGNIAWRVNLSSALYGSVAAAFIFKTAFVLGGDTRTSDRDGLFAGILASLMFAFGENNWYNATQAEVFPLNNALCAMLLYLSAEYYFRPTGGKAVRGAIVGGLCLANQHTSIFFVVPVALSVLIDSCILRKSSVDWCPVKLLVSIILSGLLVVLACYAYLPLTTLWSPVDSWGDHSTLSGILTHVLRQEYGTLKLSAGEAVGSTMQDFIARLGLYVRHIVSDFTPFALILGIVGSFELARTTEGRQKAGLVLLTAFALYEVAMTYLSNMPMDEALLVRGVYARFWQQPDIIVCVLTGVGASTLLRRVETFVLSETSSPSTSTPSSSDATSSNGHVDQQKKARKSFSSRSTLVVAIAIGAWQCSRNWSVSYQGDNWYTRQYGEAILTNLPQDAFVLLAGDLNHNAVKYLQRCEGVRSDVAAVSPELMTYRWFKATQLQHYPRVAFPGTHYHVNEEGGFHIANMIVATARERPCFIAGSWKYGDTSGEQMFDRVPFGLCDRLMPSETLVAKAKETGVALDRVLPWAAPWSAEKGNAAYAKRLARACPHFAMPNTKTRYVEGTWESVLAQNCRRAILTSMSMMTELAVHDGSKATNGATLRHAHELYRRVLRSIPTFMIDDGFIPDAYLRNAGVVAGLMSVYDASAERDMFEWWSTALRLVDSSNSSATNASDLLAIRNAVKNRVNMYAKGY